MISVRYFNTIRLQLIFNKKKKEKQSLYDNLIMKTI